MPWAQPSVDQGSQLAIKFRESVPRPLHRFPFLPAHRLQTFRQAHLRNSVAFEQAVFAHGLAVRNKVHVRTHGGILPACAGSLPRG